MCFVFICIVVYEAADRVATQSDTKNKTTYHWKVDIEKTKIALKYFWSAEIKSYILRLWDALIQKNFGFIHSFNTSGRGC